MFTLAAPPWEIVVRTAIVYGALLIGLRVMGKREIGQLTIFDLVVILLISNAVQNAMVGADVSITGGLIAAGGLLLINRLVSLLGLRSLRVRHVIEGQPTVVVSDGRYVEVAMRHEGLDREEVEMALREHGVIGVENVKLAVLELDGSISVVQKETETMRIHRHPHRGFMHQ